MSIKQALIRQNQEDIILIGTIVEKAMRGKFGDVLYAIVEGLQKKELHYSKTFPEKMSSDRVLGRIEGYDELIDKLEVAIQEKIDLTTPIMEDNDGEEN